MKFILLAAGSSAFPTGETKIADKAVNELMEHLIASTSATHNILPSHNGMQGLPSLKITTKRARPPPALQIFAKNVLEGDEPAAKFKSLDPLDHSKWAVTLHQKLALEEAKVKGLDLKSEQVIKDLKQEAFSKQLEAIKLEGLEREGLRADFESAINEHTSAVKNRIAIEKRIHTPGFKDDAERSVLRSYILASRDEFRASQNLEMKRLSSYPKSGFHSQDLRDYQ